VKKDRQKDRLNQTVICVAHGEPIASCSDVRVFKGVELVNYYVENINFKDGTVYKITFEEIVDTYDKIAAVEIID